MLRCMLFFFCTVGLRVCNLLITDNDDDETEKPTSPISKLANGNSTEFGKTSDLALNTVVACGLLLAVNTHIK